jgi:hypothetical protein
MDYDRWYQSPYNLSLKMILVHIANKSDSEQFELGDKERQAILFGRVGLLNRSG